MACLSPVTVSKLIVFLPDPYICIHCAKRWARDDRCDAAVSGPLHVALSPSFFNSLRSTIPPTIILHASIRPTSTFFSFLPSRLLVLISHAGSSYFYFICLQLCKTFSLFRLHDIAVEYWFPFGRLYDRLLLLAIIWRVIVNLWRGDTFTEGSWLVQPSSEVFTRRLYLVWLVYNSFSRETREVLHCHATLPTYNNTRLVLRPYLLGTYCLDFCIVFWSGVFSRLNGIWYFFFSKSRFFLSNHGNFSLLQHSISINSSYSMGTHLNIFWGGFTLSLFIKQFFGLGYGLNEK